jgi:hypothetical protein
MRYVFHNDKRQANVKEEVFVTPPEQLKDIKVVVNAFHTFENQKPGLDKSLEEKEVFVFHNDKRQADAKVKGPIKKKM